MDAPWSLPGLQVDSIATSGSVELPHHTGSDWGNMVVAVDYWFKDRSVRYQQNESLSLYHSILLLPVE
jgi:hypothetical protein